jgi:ribonuclease T2
MKHYNKKSAYRFTALLLVCLLGFSGFAEARRSHNNNNNNNSNSAAASPGQFDYFLLALSWSPEFCSTPAGQQASKQTQCSAKLGFVIHGLWPQYNGKGYPQDCGQASDVPDSVAAIAQNAQPPMPSGDPGLISHEWSKHGTCSGLSMTDYFTAIKTSAEKVKIPENLKAPQTSLTLDADAITAAFTAANPGLTADMLNIEVDREGEVSGVEVCFSKQLNFQPCVGGHKLNGGTFLPVN